MRKVDHDPVPPETGVEKPVFSVIVGEKLRLDLNNKGAEAAVLVACATAACCVCSVANGGEAAIRIGIEIVNRLIK